MVEYSFASDQEPTVAHRGIDEGSEYDNITWMNESNKDLFKLKKSVTKVIDINEIEDDKLNKMIQKDLDIDTTRLITNQVKIDFDSADDYEDISPRRKFVPYQK